MKVFEYKYTDSAIFAEELKALKTWCNNHVVSNVLFHTYTHYTD